MTARGSGKRPAGGAVVVTGLDEIDRRLGLLAPAVQKKHVRRSMRAGMKLIQAAVKRNAPTPGTDPYATGATRKAVKVRALKGGKRGRMGIEVRIGKGDYVGGAYYAAFREYGTSKQPARPIMGPAFRADGGSARDLARRELLRGVEAEVRTLRGR